MTTITIMLAPADKMLEFYFTSDIVSVAKMHKAEYTVTKSIECDPVGEPAAEYAFDLTNNPSRRDERESLYGRGRSVSVGDIVVVDGVEFVCAPSGWEVI